MTSPVRTPENFDDYSILMVAHFDENFLNYWEEFLSFIGRNDKVPYGLFRETYKHLAPYFRELVITLYLHHAWRIPLYKTEALRLIPVKHAVSAQKYIKMAESLGWITLTPSVKDKRQIIVSPSEALLSATKNHFARLIKQIILIAKVINEKQLRSHFNDKEGLADDTIEYIIAAVFKDYQKIINESAS